MWQSLQCDAGVCHGPAARKRSIGALQEAWGDGASRQAKESRSTQLRGSQREAQVTQRSQLFHQLLCTPTDRECSEPGLARGCVSAETIASARRADSGSDAYRHIWVSIGTTICVQAAMRNIVTLRELYPNFVTRVNSLHPSGVQWAWIGVTQYTMHFLLTLGILLQAQAQLSQDLPDRALQLEVSVLHARGGCGFVTRQRAPHHRGNPSLGVKLLATLCHLSSACVLVVPAPVVTCTCKHCCQRCSPSSVANTQLPRDQSLSMLWRVLTKLYCRPDSRQE